MYQVAITLINAKTGEEREYPTLRAAADAIGVNPSQLSTAYHRNGLCHGYSVRQGAIRPKLQGSTNICFDCKKACGDCSWSEIDLDTKKPRFEPVSGWTAEPVTYTGYRGELCTWHVIACPLFEPDEYRKPNYAMLTEEQSVHFLENLEKYLRRWADE